MGYMKIRNVKIFSTVFYRNTSLAFEVYDVDFKKSYNTQIYMDKRYKIIYRTRFTNFFAGNKNDLAVLFKEAKVFAVSNRKILMNVLQKLDTMLKKYFFEAIKSLFINLISNLKTRINCRTMLD